MTGFVPVGNIIPKINSIFYRANKLEKEYSS